MLDIALWLFNRKYPYIALFFIALFGWFTFSGYQDLQERTKLDREGKVAQATVTKRYVEPATCPGETGIKALTCNTDKPYADYTFEAEGTTVQDRANTSVSFAFLETQDSFPVTYLAGDPMNHRIETGKPRETGWMHLPLGLAIGPILMALMGLLFWRKGGFKR